MSKRDVVFILCIGVLSATAITQQITINEIIQFREDDFGIIWQQISLIRETHDTNVDITNDKFDDLYQKIEELQK